MPEQNFAEELKERTLKYFSDRQIELSVSVRNAIEDAFDEFDFEYDYPDNDAVSIYAKSDLEEFEADTSVFTELEVQIRSGYSSGDVMNKYTYYGELSTSKAVTEYINLYDGDELINEIRKIEKTENNKLKNPNDFCVLVLEEQKFSNGEFDNIPRVFIYVPRDWDDGDNE